MNITRHDLTHSTPDIAYLGAGHDIAGETLTGPALVITSGDTAIFSGVRPADVIAFARRLIEVAVAGPKAPPLRCTECQEETGSVTAAGLCSDCDTEAKLAVGVR